MGDSTSLRSVWIEQNHLEYGDRYHDLHWISPEEAAVAEAERSQLLQSFKNDVNKTCEGTKYHFGELSPGCKACTAGTWSCLFINNKCNADCFFCPTEQNEIGEPGTNTVSFSRPRDYLDYLEQFEFQGSSISGGEPFLSFDRTHLYVEKIKKKFGDRIHLWLYTNGLHQTERRLKQLSEAGLDEIRFNLVALQYDLSRVKAAVPLFPVVTVEIPAIPEDEERLKALLPEIGEIGVRHLNLHQLRVTPFNVSHMIERRYRVVHGPKVTVVDSELTALRSLQFVHNNQIDLPVNYCSFVYKNRYQAKAARHRAALKGLQPDEKITPAGFIRKLTPAVPETGGWTVSYASASLRMSPSYRCPFQEVALNSKRSLYLERMSRLSSHPIDLKQIQELGSPDLERLTESLAANPSTAAFEELEKGLLPYEG